MITAAWWKANNDETVSCKLCPQGCTLLPGLTGPCGTRTNIDGEMRALHYGKVVSAGMDPIEKKPLYHYHPGRSILSVAAPGCNLHCLFCQNHSISQGQGQDRGARTTSLTPNQMVQAALEQGAVGVAYTYSEPLVWFEFVRDAAPLVRAAGLKNVLVTNAFLNPEPLAEILPFIDAANIDLKSMDPKFYRDICKAELAPVLSAIRQFHAAGVHIELTNLVIPGHNDSDEQIDELVDWVADLDEQIPLHFTAYRPAYKMKAPATDGKTLVRAWQRARAKLPWVYLGNVSEAEGRDSVCPHCETDLIGREGFQARVAMKKDGRCPGCHRLLPFVFD